MKAWTPDEDARLLELYRLGRSTTRSSDRYRVMQWTAEHYSSSSPDTSHTSAYRRLDRLLELGVEAAQDLTLPQEPQGIDPQLC